MKIAILGFGTVGSGACETIKSTDELEVKRILDIREVPGLGHLVTREIKDILEDPEIDIVAECMGGIHPAVDFVLGAMRAGKHVVTANKNMVSACYDELMKTARENGVEFRFTPAAGGGIPWLYNLRRSKRCDEIEEVHGIVNGTCNFILDKMHTDGANFDAVLTEAQSLGYAERDPSSDIDGHDTQRKCVLSANIAFDTNIKEENVPTFGIRNITAADVKYFEANGFICKLLMNAGVLSGKDGADDPGDTRGADEAKMYAYVEPQLYRPEALESAVRTNYNLISLTAKNVGRLSFFGQGAGKMPTGASLVQDMLDICEARGTGAGSVAGSAVGSAVRAGDAAPADRSGGAGKLSHIDNSIVAHRYYMHVTDASGIPGEIIEKSKELADDLVILTKRISVADAHRIAAEYQARGKYFFMAGIV